MKATFSRFLESIVCVYLKHPQKAQIWNGRHSAYSFVILIYTNSQTKQL